MNKICEYNKCTGCKACKNICPVNAISFYEYKENYPKINAEKCIDCQMCKNVCVNNNLLEFKKYKEIYASWSLDEDIRKNAASGGTITSIYINAINNNYVCYGVELNENFEAKFKRIDSVKDLNKIRNSKYLYSDMDDIYISIKKELNKNKNVLFVGMPCQVAGLLLFLRKKYNNLVTIDIVCHGMSPSRYFKEHIEYIKEKYNVKNIKNIMFRNNNIFDMTIITLSNKKIILKEKIDSYLVGYYNGVTYRQACYSCKFARRERVADLTVCDYWNLKEYKREIREKGITGLLINTNKGKSFIQNNRNGIFLELKDNEYGMENNMAMNKPYQENCYRKKFIKNLQKYGNFESAINKTIKYKIIKNKIIYSDTILKIKEKIKKIIIGDKI